MDLEESLKKYNSKNQFDKIRRRTRNNKELSVFYEWLAEENEEVVYVLSQNEEICRRDSVLVPKGTYMRTAKNVRECCQYWQLNYYRLQGVKDLIKTNACHNRFCDNCQSIMAVQRFRKYGPILDVIAEKFDIYHIVFTVPNCEKFSLNATIDNVFKQFAYIIRLFTGNAKIKGYDFEKYGFYGAIRALEITKNAENGTFHPHLHTLFVLRKGQKLDVDRTHINTYSFTNDEHFKRSHHKKVSGEPNRKFGDFEILLQKVWRLRVDGVRVNERNIENLPIGYSVICDNADGRYKEVFKYATKGLFKDSKEEKAADEWEKAQKMNVRYNDFKLFEAALKGRKIIQGYSHLNHFKFLETVEQDAKNDEAYIELLKKLHAIENPEQFFEYFDELFEQEEKKMFKFVSRKTIAEVLAQDDGEEWELKT